MYWLSPTVLDAAAISMRWFVASTHVIALAFDEIMLVDDKTGWGAAHRCIVGDQNVLSDEGRPYGRGSIHRERALIVSDTDRDETISVEMQFDALKFVRMEQGVEASAVLMATFQASAEPTSSPDASASGLRLDIRFEAAPDRDSVLAIVERGRALALQQLRALTSQLESETAETLLLGRDGER